MMQVRKATEADKSAVWQIIRSVIAGGDTYTFAPDTPEDVMIAFWFSPEKHVYVAEDDRIVLGTYWLKANQPGLGDHVGNGGYMVSPDAKGKGIGKLMAEHSIEEARRIGIDPIQLRRQIKHGRSQPLEVCRVRGDRRDPRRHSPLATRPHECVHYVP